MEGTYGGLEFVNREAETAFLMKCFEGDTPTPAMVIIRSPTGFGKSRLTDQFRSVYAGAPYSFCVVDPSIRSGIGETRLYNGFFLQRSAEALSALGSLPGSKWPTLDDYLKRRRWKTAAEKPFSETLGDLPSAGSLYKVAFDYAYRLFGAGKYGAKQLLSSDQSSAVSICAEYARAILSGHPIVLILREAQHIDLESLRELLLLNHTRSGAHLIFEYTSDNGRFAPEHEKAFLRAAEERKSISILDLARLNFDHLERLIQTHIKSDFALESQYYLSWDGNLRSVVELRFRVAIGHRLAGPAAIISVLDNVKRSVESHITDLSSVERLVLATLSAHVEAIDQSTLSAIISTIDPRAQPLSVSGGIADLEKRHRFVAQIDGRLRLHDETIALAISTMASMRPLIAISEKALRDHYRALLDSRDYSATGISVAVRQMFRLCARTKDAAGLINATSALLDEIKHARDQTIYVNAISSAIEADPALYGKDHDGLVLWAASLAYSVCDWERVTSLLRSKSSQDAFSMMMNACALQEIGEHDEALSIARELAVSGTTSNQRLAGYLVQALINGCRGNQDEARAELKALIDNPEYCSSPLLGYAYRFFEVVDGFVECLDKLESSIAWFDRFGFEKSKAYSQLPAAMFLARVGRIEEAKALLSEAHRTLADEVRDQHMLLNNQAAVDMLSDSPDFSKCASMLTNALRFARDDFSELTILSNLGLANWMCGRTGEAVDCAEKTLKILENHDFADKDIYWPVCFNAARILSATGFADRSSEALAFPRHKGRPVSVNQNYWAYRYGEKSTIDAQYVFLASRPAHPMYLSHWIIDLEGLELLKQE